MFITCYCTQSVITEIQDIDVYLYIYIQGVPGGM